jgi:DnaK suppressor protein
MRLDCAGTPPARAVPVRRAASQCRAPGGFATFAGLIASYPFRWREMRTTLNGKHDTYKDVLEQKAAEVRKSMSAQKAAQMLSRGLHSHDEGDLSQQSHEEWLFLNRNSLDLHLLREVDGALRRIEEGTYGTCAECEEPISPKRLKAVPWARYCVTCQERLSEDGLPSDAHSVQEAQK